MFLKFIGPMRTLSKGGVRFEKGKIYKVSDEEKAQTLLDTGRFRETTDPSKGRPSSRGGVRFKPREEPEETGQEERGDMSLDDLKKGGAKATGAPVEEVRDEDEDRPKLPAAGFTSKNEAIKFAKQHFDVDLDKKKAIGILNKEIVSLYTERYSKAQVEDVDDDVRDENTKTEAVVVA